MSYNAPFQTMSDDEDDAETIACFSPFFYPSSESTPPDPVSTAKRLTCHLQATPDETGCFADELPTFLLHIATAHPAHTDHALLSTKHLLNTPSLPLLNIPHISYKTFKELFDYAFPNDVDNSIRGPIDVKERALYIAASLLAGRARSMGMLYTPQTVGSLAEGLGFQGEVLYHYQGEQAEIAVIGACLQLMGGAVFLIQNQPERFAKDKILAALDCLQSSPNDALIKFTKRHLQKEPLVDLTSEEIAASLKLMGWSGP